MSNLSGFITNHTEIISSLNELSYDIDASIDAMVASIKKGNKIMICGNGGSAADSQHISSELVGRYKKERDPISAIALTTDSSSLTCISNDYSYEQVFSRQIRAIGKKGDILIGISTSGNSDNVYNAILEAKEMHISSIGLLGKGGGNILNIVDFPIVVKDAPTGITQEAHILIAHYICSEIEKKLGLV